MDYFGWHIQCVVWSTADPGEFAHLPKWAVSLELLSWSSSLHSPRICFLKKSIQARKVKIALLAFCLKFWQGLNRFQRLLPFESFPALFRKNTINLVAAAISIRTRGELFRLSRGVSHFFGCVHLFWLRICVMHTRGSLSLPHVYLSAKSQDL